MLLVGLLVFGDLIPSWAMRVGACLGLLLISAGVLCLRRVPVVAALVALGASALPGFWTAVDRPRSWTGLCLLEASLLTFLIVLFSINSECSLRRLCGAVVLAGVALAVGGPLLFDYQSKGRLLGSWQGLNVVGDPLDPNVLAGVLAMVLPASLALALYRRRFWDWGSVAFLLVGAGLIISESIGGCLAALLSCCLLLAWGERIKWTASLLLASSLALLVVVFSFHSQVSQLVHHFLTGRLELWERALYLLQEFALSGVGPRSFGVAANRLHPFLGSPSDQIYPHPHSLGLEVGVENGMGGLVAFLLLIFLCTIGGWKWIRTFRSGEPYSLLIAGFWCGVVAHLIHGFVDSPLWMNRPMPLLFLFLAVPVSGAAEPSSTQKAALKVLLAWVGLSLVGLVALTWSPLWAVFIVTAGSLVWSWTFLQPH